MELRADLVNLTSPPQAKIALFRSLFRGREDVYPRRFESRRTGRSGYEAIGYMVMLPASAIPGWPTDVILPSDPIWKRDYAASVRRLVRDGVDTPLASLFVHATRAVAPASEGVDRARSATEAFLLRRLETLPQAKGRFVLNEKLPIPFDGKSELEVDLLCR